MAKKRILNKAKVKNNKPVPIHGLQPGDEITIDIDDNGIPIDKNWRRRLRDSAIDGCVTITKINKNGKKKPTKKIDKEQVEE